MSEFQIFNVRKLLGIDCE